MDKIKSFIREKSIWIIAVLFALLVLKSCKSCSRNQENAFQKHRTEIEADSLKREIQKRDDTIYILCDSISVLNTKLSSAEAVIERLDKDKSDYKRISEQLAKRPVQTTISK